MYDQGHWVGLHGYTHQSFPRLKPPDLYQGLQRTQSMIAHTCGLEPDRIRDVRPPNGLFTPRTLIGCGNGVSASDVDRGTGRLAEPRY